VIIQHKQKRRVGISLIGLTPTYIYACPFSMSYAVVPFFVLSELWWEVTVRFVDIDGIINHHNFFK